MDVTNIDREEWNMKIGIICRQTSYTEEEASEQLKLSNGDILNVLSTYVEVPESTEDSNKLSTTVNQEIFNQIRSVMDTASKTYRESKGLEDIERRRQELLLQQQKQIDELISPENNSTKDDKK